MPVKVETVSRWEARLEGDASVPSLSVNSIDADEKSVKVKLGTTERIALERSVRVGADASPSPEPLRPRGE